MRSIDICVLDTIVGNVIPPLSTVLAVVAIGMSTIAMYKLFTSSKGKIELAEHFGVSWN